MLAENQYLKFQSQILGSEITNWLQNFTNCKIDYVVNNHIQWRPASASRSGQSDAGIIDRIYLPKKVTEDGGYKKKSQQDYSQGQSWYVTELFYMAPFDQ